MATIATLRKSGNVESNQAFKGFPEGQMFVRQATISTPTLALNDVIQALDVFAGETLHDIIVKSTDIDTNGSPAVVLDVGYGNSTTATAATSDDIIDGSTIGQAGGTAVAGVLHVMTMLEQQQKVQLTSEILLIFMYKSHLLQLLLVQLQSQVILARQ